MVINMKALKTDLEAILESFKKKMRIMDEGEEAFLVMPFFRLREDDSMVLKFFEEDDCLYISDSGDTVRYLSDRGGNIEDYRESFEKIKKKYFIKERGEYELVLEFPSESASAVHTFVGYFIEGLTLIGNLALIG